MITKEEIKESVLNYIYEEDNEFLDGLIDWIYGQILLEVFHAKGEN